MTTIQILVIESFDVELPDPPGRAIVSFSNDLALERYDDSTPGGPAAG